ncbi:ferric reductase like transmembrane component-domain-containing protein [Mycena epipterygia]|nr:ferric reductase like transmembrane component-domain-containing protein [Mycena epipterygia]
MSHGTPPVIPADLLPYESYVEDPKWQTRFTAMWCAALGLCIILAAPRALRLKSLKERARGMLGIRVRGEYEALPSDDKGGGGSGAIPPLQSANALTTTARVLRSSTLWSLPGITLNVGQMFVVAGYAVFALVCIVLQAPLMENPNRAGFLALAQLPPVFLFASKNSPLTALLLGPGVDYTKLNYIHRWAGRGLFLGAAVHGALWINNHVIWDLPILSQQKEGSGVAAFGTLCVLVLSSIAPIRRWCYSGFLVIHFLTFPAFFITICYHTIYASPWIIPPIAFYAADVLLRVLRWRVVAARLEAREGGLALIHIPLANRGWRAGQHVQVRAMVGGRAWEAHPLSVCCAPEERTCLTGPDGAPLGMLLAARACGDWSRALHDFASTGDVDDVLEKRVPSPDDAALHHDDDDDDDAVVPGRDAHLVLEGPYGGPTLRATDFETVLLFAGGSGATFTLGVLDDLVGRCARNGRREGEQTRRVMWCWCVRSFGAINWFAPYLLQIATLAARPDSGIELTIRIFVTCLCDPDAVPAIPGCTVTEARPSVGGVLAGLLGSTDYVGSEIASAEPLPECAVVETLPAGDIEKGAGADVYTQGGGGVAVFAAGPGSLIREAGNAVARANLSGRGRAAGGVEFCAEAFTV